MRMMSSHQTVNASSNIIICAMPIVRGQAGTEPLTSKFVGAGFPFGAFLCTIELYCHSHHSQIYRSSTEFKGPTPIAIGTSSD